MVNDSISPIPQVEENNKQYNYRSIKRGDFARQYQHIIGQPVKQILHAFDNNILQILPIIWEDVGMAEEFYGTSMPHLQGNIVRHKVQHVEPIIAPNYLKGILDR